MASNNSEGLKIFQSCPADIVIAEENMLTGGRRFFQLLRQRKYLARLPYILILKDVGLIKPMNLSLMVPLASWRGLFFAVDFDLCLERSTKYLVSLSRAWGQAVYWAARLMVEPLSPCAACRR
ncbi:hypothetical protein [Pseudomonas sp. OV226]|uniref:hypothetical protein n=1 Tax=Pseudomonas sp. OV226 TaxID=2135588 RepID=UPI0013048671|nr:hypothetical protein [Pseudomonas sp. OV226]